MDNFLKQESCERCGTELKSRIMSWFTEEVICIDKCWREEQELKSNLPNRGRNYEGCGFIPELETYTLFNVK